MKSLLFLLLFSIFSPSFSLCAFYRTPKYIKLAERLMCSYSKYLAREKGLCLVGEGGAMMDDIKEICLALQSHSKLNIDEARKLYLEITEKFLEIINQNEQIRPYLHNYPFTIDNLDIMLSFRDEMGYPVTGEYVSLMFYKKDLGLLFYEGNNGAETRPYYSLHQETYVDALKIIQEQKKKN